jgi:hypothetical protein
MKKNILVVGVFLLLALGACKKNNPAPAQQSVDLLANKWTWVQTTTQDYPDVGQPAQPQTVVAPDTSYWEFKSTGDLNIFSGAGSGVAITHWTRLDDKNFLMPFSSICLISVLDAHNLTFSRTEPYSNPQDNGSIKYTYLFTR